MLDLLNGTETAPAKLLEVEDPEKKKTQVPNPAYSAWLIRDQTVLRWIVNSLSPEILAHVVDIDSSAAVWTVLTKMFTVSSRSKINQLRGELNSTKKHDLTAAQFFAKMKGFAPELAAIGKPVEEDEMIGYIVNGLDSSYTM